MEMHPTKLASVPLPQRGSPHEMVGLFPSLSHPHFRYNIKHSTQPSLPRAQPRPLHLSVILAYQLGISLQPEIVSGRQTNKTIRPSGLPLEVRSKGESRAEVSVS